MNGNTSPFQRDDERQLADEVLGYLLRHPEAQDTVEGVAEWWLLERRVAEAMANVEAVVSSLVAREFLVATEAKDGRVYYRLNREREREIRCHLRKAGSPGDEMESSPSS
jgi:hypothetical protein